MNELYCEEALYKSYLASTKASMFSVNHEAWVRAEHY